MKGLLIKKNGDLVSVLWGIVFEMMPLPLRRETAMYFHRHLIVLI